MPFDVCALELLQRVLESFGRFAFGGWQSDSLPGRVFGVAGGQVDAAADVAGGGGLGGLDADLIDRCLVAVGDEADVDLPSVEQVAGHPKPGFVE